jgi:signal transduction histidine kinase
MSFIKNKNSIASGFFISTVLLIIFAVSMTGSFWIYLEYSRFEKESKKLKTDYLKIQEDTIRHEVTKAIEYINYKKNQLEDELKNSLKQRTYEAYQIAYNIYRKNINKSPEEIKERISEALAPIRFNKGRGYFFVEDMSQGPDKCIGIVLPGKVGENRFYAVDKNGKYYIQDIIKVVKSPAKEGFVKYYREKPEGVGEKNKTYPKIAFAKYFEPFDWFIGTGEYLDDFEKDIQQTVMKRLSNMRFGSDGNGYIFVEDFDGHQIVNDIQKNLVGINITDLEDIHGVKIAQELKKAALKPDGGFVEYYWIKPSTGKNAPKLSYAKSVYAWKWIVGAGVYIDEIEKILGEKKQILRKSVNRYILNIILTLLIMILICLFLAKYFISKTEKAINTFVDFFRRAETESIEMNPEELTFSEFQILAESANRMILKRRHAEEELLRINENLEENIRKRTEDLAEANRNLQAAGRAKDEFLANMSHEIRTPMNSIMGMTELLLNTEIEEYQQKLLEIIKNSSLSLLEIINEILDYSKMESGKFTLNCFEFIPQDCIANALDPLLFKAMEKGLKLESDISKDIPEHLYGDAIRIRQILTNLVGNAIKFTREGMVKVTADIQSEDEDNVVLCFRITDTGIGIPRSKHKVIFNTFTQADGSTTREFGGTGLGLTIVFKLVKMMQGDIELESELGKGSSFTVTLKLQKISPTLSAE